MSASWASWIGKSPARECREPRRGAPYHIDLVPVLPDLLLLLRFVRCRAFATTIFLSTDRVLRGLRWVPFWGRFRFFVHPNRSFHNEGPPGSRLLRPVRPVRELIPSNVRTSRVSRAGRKLLSRSSVASSAALLWGCVWVGRESGHRPRLPTKKYYPFCPSPAAPPPSLVLLVLWLRWRLKCHHRAVHSFRLPFFGLGGGALASLRPHHPAQRDSEVYPRVLQWITHVWIDVLHGQANSSQSQPLLLWMKPSSFPDNRLART